MVASGSSFADRARRGGVVLVVLALTGCGVSDVGSAVAAGEPSTAGAVTLVEAPRYHPPALPVSPTWQPGPPLSYGFSDPLWAERMDGFDGWDVVYAEAELSLIVTDTDPEWFDTLQGDRSEPTPVTMLGLEGEEYAVTRDDGVRWVCLATDRTGRSVIVSGSDRDAVRRMATGLRREPTQLKPPFQVARLPERYVPVRMTSHEMEFMSPDEGTVGSILVTISTPNPHDDQTGTPTTVNGNPAELIIEEYLTRVRIQLPDGSHLNVVAFEQPGLTAEQVLEIAAGVTVTADAIPGVVAG